MAVSVPLQAMPSPGTYSGSDPLTIGGCTFAIEEAPLELAFGINSTIVEKVSIGGKKRTQVLGSRPKNVAWDGELFENADSQIAILQALADSQELTTLTWRRATGELKQFSVIVSDFQVPWQSSLHALYHIAVSVQADLTSTTKASASSVDSAVSSNLDNANASYTQILAVDPTAVDALTPQSEIDAAVANMGPVASGSANSASALSTISTAIGKVQTYLGALPTLSAAVLPATSHLGALQVLSANITRGQSPTSILVDGASTSLLRLGAQYYPGIEPTVSASAIRDANGLSALFLDRGSQRRLLLPPLGGQAVLA